MINPLYMEDLNEVILMEDKQRFQITDMSSLTWGLRKMSAIEAKKAEINQVVDAEIERLELFRKKEMDTLQGSEDFFRCLIGEYALRKRDEDSNFKNMKTPYGSIGFRKQQPKWNYDDEKLLSFLEQNGHDSLIRIKKEPSKTDIKKVFTANDDGRVYDENGQEVEGIKIELLPDTLDVKVGAV